MLGLGWETFDQVMALALEPRGIVLERPGLDNQGLVVTAELFDTSQLPVEGDRLRGSSASAMT